MTTDDEITRDQLSLIYDNTNDMIFMVGVEDEGRYRALSVNRSYLDATGVAAGEFLGRCIDEIFPPEEAAYVSARYDEAVRSGRPHRYETLTTLRTGSVYLETTLVPIFAEERCTHLIGVSRDITERKLERKALEAEKARAETYLDISQAIILGLDRDGRVTLLNRKGYRVLGYPEGSLQGKDWIGTVMNKAKEAELRAALADALETGAVPERVSTYLFARDGQRRLVRWTLSLVLGENEAVAGFLASGEDVSERREAERSLVASQRLLAAGEVAAAVAHDFNNALQGILGSLELALDDATMSADSRAKLETASTLAGDAAERLQTLQRLNSSSGARDAEPVNLNVLVTDVIDQTQHLWRDNAQKVGRQIVVHSSLGGGELLTLGQPGDLRSVLFNLVKNSIEALESGGEINIETSVEDGTNVVRVVDSGAGMDRETRDRVFQPFFSTKGFEAGRGLGLSASYGIVRAHEGELLVRRSAPGAGTTMELRLPVMEPRLLRGALRAGNRPEALKVLWVDDDPAVRSMALGYLEVLGLTGDVAASGAQALELLGAGRYDVVITDIGMPGMSGFEVARRVAELTAGATAVLALTGWGDTITPAEQQQASIYRVLSKPISIETLGEALAGLG